MNLRITAVLVALLVSGSAWGERDLWSEILWTNADTREERVLLASEIRRLLYVDKFLEMIPRLSPNEEEWLKQELSSTDSNSVSKAANSNELVVKEARETMEFVDANLNLIVRDEANEFVYLVRLASILMNDARTEYVGILCERDIVSPCPLDGTGDYRHAASFLYKHYEKIILLKTTLFREHYHTARGNETG